MDDLAGKISEILNDPASMEKIKNLSNMLGIAPDSQDSSPTGQTAPAAPQNANPFGSLAGRPGRKRTGRRRAGSISWLKRLRGWRGKSEREPGNAPVYPENRPAVIQCSAGG